jgi:hypothetical protein
LTRPGPFACGLASALALGSVAAFSAGLWEASWVCLGLLFLAIEISAAVNGQPGDTLSERTWVWMGVKPFRASRWLRSSLLGLFLAELALHFASGGGAWWNDGKAVIVTGIPVGLVIGWSLIERS